jgi:23S rRNA G2445 N2-methylase RlmL
MPSEAVQALVYRVAPKRKRSFGFGEGKQFSQTAGDSLMAEIATTASELRCRHC